MSSSLCTCYPLNHYISCVPTSDNEYTEGLALRDTNKSDIKEEEKRRRKDIFENWITRLLKNDLPHLCIGQKFSVIV